MIIGIIGMTQGGTSAVASVVKALDVPMWGLDRTLDDAELFGPIKIPTEVIEKRNSLKTLWAWKYPLAYSHELDFSDKFIVVWRDPIARATHRRDLNAPNMSVFNESFELMESFRKIKKPHLHVSYEKLLQKTPEVVGSMADFIGVPVTPLALLAVDPKKGYEKTKEINEGVIN